MRTAEAQKAYIDSHPEQAEKKRARSKARYKNRHSARWKAFGGTLELFNAYWLKQGGRCGICKAKMKKRGEQGQQGKIAQFDHCHNTLRPRGLLCMRCNTRFDWYIQFKEQIKEYYDGTL